MATLGDRTAAAATAIRKARELTEALHAAEALGVQLDVQVEIIPIAGQPPLRQIMVYLLGPA